VLKYGCAPQATGSFCGFRPDLGAKSSSAQ
jgi:hypothetical protein